MKSKLSDKKHLLIVPIYGLLYLIGFAIVERLITNDYVVIHTSLDDLIPFCEYFVVFYYVWFIYMAITVVFVSSGDKGDFLKTAVFLMIGMTLFVVVSVIFPNGQDLRPNEFARNNFFTKLVKGMYELDTPTNILPSIHVYNSIGCHIGLCRCKEIKDKRWARVLSLVTCIAIIMSTMFIKQHSVLDVISAIVLSVVIYPLAYRTDWVELIEKAKNKFA